MGKSRTNDIKVNEVKKAQSELCELVKNIKDLSMLEYYYTFIMLSKDMWCANDK